MNGRDENLLAYQGREVIAEPALQFCRLGSAGFYKGVNGFDHLRHRARSCPQLDLTMQVGDVSLEVPLSHRSPPRLSAG